MDIYSCKEYSVRKAIAFTRRYFEPRKIERQFILRGQHYFDSYSKKE